MSGLDELCVGVWPCVYVCCRAGAAGVLISGSVCEVCRMSLVSLLCCVVRCVVLPVPNMCQVFLLSAPGVSIDPIGVGQCSGSETDNRNTHSLNLRPAFSCCSHCTGAACWVCRFNNRRGFHPFNQIYL